MRPTWNDLENMLRIGKRRSNGGKTARRSSASDDPASHARSIRENYRKRLEYKLIDDAPLEESEADDDSASTTATVAWEENEKRDSLLDPADYQLPIGSPRPFIHDYAAFDAFDACRGQRMRIISPGSVREPFTKNHGLMDNMLDAILRVASFTHRDKSNVRAMNRAKANGVKVRDFVGAAERPAPLEIKPQKDEPAPSIPKDTPIVVFDAHHKALQFFYLRFLITIGFYDLPDYDLSVDDVDHLYTCGVIELKDLDNVVVASMFGHGLYRRIARTYGLPLTGGTVIPPPAPWTVPIDYRRPTQDEIFRYIARHEYCRFQQRFAPPLYRIAAFERPVMSAEYVRHRLDRDGYWGLVRMAGFSDDEVEAMLEIKDASFIPPERYLGRPNMQPAAPLEGQPTEPLIGPGEPKAGPSTAPARSSPATSSIGASPADAVRDISTAGSNKEKQSATASAEQHGKDADLQAPATLDGSPQPLSSGSKRKKRSLPLEEQPTEPLIDPQDGPSVGPSQTSYSSSDENLPTPARDGSRARAKGKKRARYASEESSDDTGRRTRQRTSPPETSVASGASSPSSTLTTEPSGTGKGKKRAREDDTEVEGVIESSPTKKAKNAQGIVATDRSQDSKPASSTKGCAAPAAGPSCSVPAIMVHSPGGTTLFSSATTSDAPAPGPSGAPGPTSTTPDVSRTPAAARPRGPSRGPAVISVDQTNGEFLVYSRAKVTRVPELRLVVPPDTERGPAYSVLMTGSSQIIWSDVCRNFHELEVSNREQAQSQPESGVRPVSESQSEDPSSSWMNAFRSSFSRLFQR